MEWRIKNGELHLNRTLLMGVVNVTPDSFSDGGRYARPEAAARRVFQLAEEGADIIDLGGESTRPGALAVSVEEELERLLPVLQKVSGRIPVPVSIDTTKAEVACACLQEGAHIINDVSSLCESGDRMAEVVRTFGAGFILMHRRGTPQTMQAFAHYGDVVEEVTSELEQRIAHARRAGIHEGQLAVDPGLGFAKDTEQNLEILRGLEKFHSLNLPLVLGPSRKSFIGKITGRETGEREYGTAAVATWSVMKGVHILRVHEVRAMRDAVRMAEAIRGEIYVGTF